MALSCSANCSLCSANGVCLKCVNPLHSYNSLEKKCVSACELANCASCMPYSEICLECIQGFAIYEWSGVCRPTLIANCAQFIDYRGEEYFCSLCLAGYVPTADQKECRLANCSTITDCQVCNNGTCSQCRVGYSPTSAGTLCTPNACNLSSCLYCTVNGTCLRCGSAFFLADGQCLSSFCQLPFCTSCKKNSLFCDTCMTGYTWNVWTTQCEASVVNNCKI